MRDAQIINSLNYLVPSNVYVCLWDGGLECMESLSRPDLGDNVCEGGTRHSRPDLGDNVCEGGTRHSRPDLGDTVCEGALATPTLTLVTMCVRGALTPLDLT